MPLDAFHPILKRWFEATFGAPTEAQLQAWPGIRGGEHTLIAAPTGSGKTLAAFYAAIDGLVVDGLHEQLRDETRVLYISPLKALSNDIERNLRIPVQGIRKALHQASLPDVNISVAVRTGDTMPRERRKMLLVPPHILVTTPESFYLLLTSARGRAVLATVRQLIIDEIHAVVGDKRGAHLALSVERLQALTGAPLQRIGLSATQTPIDEVARFLVGGRHITNDIPQCHIVDTGRRCEWDVGIRVPRAPLTAVMSNDVWTEVYQQLVALIQAHRTTLIFVNTRRLAERLALALADPVGEDNISSHHGSMSREHRHAAEQRLKDGRLRVLVATASMELGIDVGAIDLVIQISSPRRIAAFVQRVGRSGHHVGGTPKGILFPLSRDDLVECAALVQSVRRSELDQIEVPPSPLDVLAQQIVAEAAMKEWEIAALYALYRYAFPFRHLEKARFRDIIYMLANGFTTRRGRRGAHIHLDAVNQVIRGRRGAGLTALTNGGTIPDMFDYDVVLQPEGITVGSINEDYALESLPGDIFTLGVHAWRLLRIQGMKVMVEDAAGKPPTVPFWFGEGPGRSTELSDAVSQLRHDIDMRLDDAPVPAPDTSGYLDIDKHPAVRWLVDHVGIGADAASQIVLYLYMGRTGLGVMPTRETIVMERFFDDAGDSHVVIHSPYGSRINRGWGLALRKKFCRNFNFELQAAATDDSIILSLSSSHSFPLESVFNYLSPKTVRETLVQAMLDAPVFEVRWRWNATRSLAIRRFWSGKRVPPALQRLQAEDLIAQVFPDQIACLENIAGDRDVPDHPLVDQTIQDCLTEAMDIAGLEAVLEKMADGSIRLVARDLCEPSIFAQEVINARPYAFLDDTEIAERRVNAIRNRSWLDPAEASDLGKLDAEAIRRVRDEAWPRATTDDGLHDALVIYGYITRAEGEEAAWAPMFASLVTAGRALAVAPNNAVTLWIAVENADIFRRLYPAAVPAVAQSLSDWIAPSPAPATADEALREVVRGRLSALGPVLASTLADSAGLTPTRITQALIALENEGFVFRGRFSPDADEAEWCERRLLQRIHRYTIDSLRQSVEPVCGEVFFRYLVGLHGVGNANKPTGPMALEAVLERLDGYVAPAAAWEGDIIPARLSAYDPAWLDQLCATGRVVWGRLAPPRPSSRRRRRVAPIKQTPIAIYFRERVPLWQAAAGSNTHMDTERMSANARRVHDHLRERGAVFFDDLVRDLRLLSGQTEEALAELVANGLAASDSYAGLRALLTPASRRRVTHSRRRHRRPAFTMGAAGRWSLSRHALEKAPSGSDGIQLTSEHLQALAEIYLQRWGVVFRSILEKEASAPPWRLLVRVLRRMELQGRVRGGRFITNVSGEQFAKQATIDQLRKMRKRRTSRTLITLSAVDPLNLLGYVLPGERVARLAANRVLYRDGIPIAMLESGEIRQLRKIRSLTPGEIKAALLQQAHPGQLKGYLGKRRSGGSGSAAYIPS